MGSGTELGPPVFAVKNTAARWATTINYDLLIFEDKIVVARGLSFPGSVGEERLRDSVGVKRSALERNDDRVRDTSERQLEELLAADGGNRLIRVSDIASANLKRRFGTCTLTLNLQTGASLKYRWLNSGSFATDYEQAKEDFANCWGRV